MPTRHVFKTPLPGDRVTAVAAISLPVIRVPSRRPPRDATPRLGHIEHFHDRES
jgi:hypothetical protein